MSQKNPDHLIVKKQGPVAWLLLNRPQRHNALSLELADSLSQALKQVSHEEPIRVVVLRGSQKAFSAGGDLKNFYQDLDKSHDNFFAISALLNDCIHSITTMPKPVIAAIQGPAYAAGFGLAISCDLLVAESGARLSPSFVKIALSANASSTYFLPRIIGEKRAREAFLTGRSWTAEEALNLGLVSRVFSKENFEKELEQLAQNLSQAPTQTLARIKKVLQASWDNNLDKQLSLEQEQIALSSQSQDFREGLSAFIEKRAPKFVGK